MEYKQALSIIKEVTRGLPVQVNFRSQLPKTPYIYMVYNGNNILQIGKTKSGDNGGRLAYLLKGARPSIHNKSFIVGLGNIVLGGSNEYVLFPISGNKTVEQAEQEIHQKLGFKTNEEACVFLDGAHCSSISIANKILWDRYKSCSHYDLLDANEKKVAEELFKLIDSHRVKVVRSNGNSQSYSSGDILTGGILASQGLNGFANLWQKITNKYFEYTDLYLLSGPEYTNYLLNYKTIFSADAIIGNVFCKHHSVQKAKPTVTANLDDKSALGLDIVITRSQIDLAMNLLKTRPSVTKECETADMIFETSHPNYILLVTRPTESNGQNKIENLLLKIREDSELMFSNLMRTNKLTKLQYFTNVGACYVEYRKNGFKADGDRYIKQSF